MRKKYYNDAFIGNGRLTASFSKYGELLRLYYPTPDYRQYFDFFHIGVKINDSNLIYLHDDINNKYDQYYTENTNILNTEIENTYFNLFVKQTDCVLIDKDIMIKKYIFTNKNNIDLDIKLLVRAKTISTVNNLASAMVVKNSLIQYSHNFTSIIFSNKEILSHQINNVDKDIQKGEIYDKDYIGMSSDSAISYDIGILKPNESTEFYLMTFMKYEKEYSDKMHCEISNLLKLDIEKELKKTKAYWNKFIIEHDTLKLKPDGTEYTNKLIDIYKRTILCMPLLINKHTGGIVASLEIDEERDKCGRYSYCWPRDAVLTYTSIDYLGFTDITKKFYSMFLNMTQRENGMWEQRFYTDGKLAPCWGYQIDETALVVWGAYKHFKNIKNMYGRKEEKFLKDNLNMLEKATVFLERYINNVLQIEEETNDIIINNVCNDTDIHKHLSYDLWEMNEGVHLFSLSAIYAAFESMNFIYNELIGTSIKNEKEIKNIYERIDRYKYKQEKIKDYILEHLYDKQRKILVRNTNDRLTDISILGAILPFKVFKLDEEIVKNTVEYITMMLRTYSGGFLRFEEDTYVGGKNPWIIATAWMGLYYKVTGNIKSYNDCMKFIVNSATKHGYLSEQSSSDLTDRWVIGLAWSHSIFIEMLIS